MDRGSNKHSPRVDDEMSAETRGIVQGSTTGGRAEEWKMAEPFGEDQELGDGNSLTRFGTYVGRVFPAGREALLASATELNAPDDVLERIDNLPPDTTYENVAEAWRATQAG